MFKSNSGFTLMEIMIALAIVAILAVIAYPSYQEQVKKTRRADCTGGLMALAQNMERFYTQNNTYLGAAVGGANTGAPANFSTTCPLDGGTATYNLTIAAAPAPTATTYTLNAVPTGPQAGDKCGTLTLTQSGQKGITGGSAGVTWQQCWGG